MSGAERDASDVLVALRAEFAQAFMAAPATPEPTEDLVAIGVGPGRFALRIAELRALARRGAIAALPGGPPGLLGLAAERGRAVPAFDLGPIVGSGPAEVAWLAFAAAAEPVAFGFTTFGGLFRVRRADLVVDPAPAAALVATHVRLGGALHGVVDLPAAIAWLEARTAAPTP